MKFIEYNGWNRPRYNTELHRSLPKRFTDPKENLEKETVDHFLRSDPNYFYKTRLLRSVNLKDEKEVAEEHAKVQHDEMDPEMRRTTRGEEVLF